MKQTMQGKHLFEYAVIRVVPKVEREEFLNAGVILYCSGQSFLQSVFEINEKRLQAFSAGLDIVELEKRFRAFQQICAGGQEGGPIGKLSIAARFRWLTAARSTIVQTSPVHPGLSSDARATLQRLYEDLVL
jgi:hypothetical protein